MRSVALVLGLALAAATGCAWLARPLELAVDPAPALDAAEAAVLAGNWAEARRATQAVRRGWQRNLPRVRLQAEIGVINEFQRALDRLEGALDVRDRPSAALAVAELKGIWREIAAAFR